jgi:uncharacterized protein YndB with AHSA1/START domain
MAGNTTTIKQVHFIPASPEEVYDAYMDAKKHAKFTGGRATCIPKKGGRFSAWDGYIAGRNVELVKGKRIVQEWQTSVWPQGYCPSTLKIVLKKKGDGTELVMTHAKVPAEQAGEYE